MAAKCRDPNTDQRNTRNTDGRGHMFSTDDTIVAIATPPGRGGIGVVRVSGPAAATVASHLTARSGFEPRRATLTPDHRRGGRRSISVVVTYFPAPHSYTGEDVVEISAHGSPVVLERS